MRYLALCYYNAKAFETMTPEQIQDLVSGCPPRDKALHESGKVIFVDSLSAHDQAINIRPSNGTPVITRGEYQPSLDQIGAVLVIEADGEDEAIRVASLHPAANIGEQCGWGIELRKIGG